MKLIVLFAALMLVVAQESRAESLESIPLWFRADVTITPDGKATDLAWRNFTEMPANALDDLARRIADWKFRPGSIDGEPVATRTSLIIHVLAVERSEGRFGIEVANVIPGPSLETIGPGVSPYRDLLTSGSLVSGYAVLDATFEPGQAPAIEIVDLNATTGNRRYRSNLSDDSRWLVEHWQVRHETLAGEPLPARLRFINAYCWGGDWCERHPSEAMEGLPEMRPDQPVPLDSAVRWLGEPSIN